MTTRTQATLFSIIAAIGCSAMFWLPRPQEVQDPGKGNTLHCEDCRQLLATLQELRYRLYLATGDGRPDESSAPLEHSGPPLVFSRPVTEPRSIGDNVTPLTTEKVLKRLENITRLEAERDESK